MKGQHVSKSKFNKPCETLGYCPYGALVDMFPLHGRSVQWKEMHMKVEPIKDAPACRRFGHDCPVSYVGVPGTETGDQPVLVHKGENDYVLAGDNTVWIEHGSLVVWIHQRDNGVPCGGLIADILRTEDPEGDVLATARAEEEEK